MIPVATACVLLLVLTTLVHYEALRGLRSLLPRLPMMPRARVIALIIGASAAHTAEVVMWAGAMFLLARWLGTAPFGPTHAPDFSVVVYFSAETYTSLGYGDIVPHGPLRLLAGAEALTGLLMIGWSTSHVFVATDRFWETS